MRSTDNLYRIYVIDKNTKFLQVPLIQKKLSCVKTYGIVQHDISEFVSIARVLLRDTNFRIDLLQKKDYLDLFELKNKILFKKGGRTDFFKGKGFLFYSHTAHLDFFFVLLDKLHKIASLKFLLISYYGLFMDTKRILFLSKTRNTLGFYGNIVIYMAKMLLSVFSFLCCGLNLITLYLYNFFFFFKKFFFF